MVDEGPQTIDVLFPVEVGFTLDPTRYGFSQFTLGGTGIGTLVIDPNSPPQVLSTASPSATTSPAPCSTRAEP